MPTNKLNEADGQQLLAKAEDAAHASGDEGFVLLTVRKDAAASGAGTDGDYATLGTDSTGRLWVNSAAALAAGIALIGQVAAGLQTNLIYNGTTVLTPKFAVIDDALSPDNTIVAAVTGKKIRVLSLYMISAAAVTARFESGTGGTALTGQMEIAANGGFVLPFSPVGHFETAAAALLNLELSGATSCDGGITYVEV